MVVQKNREYWGTSEAIEGLILLVSIFSCNFKVKKAEFSANFLKIVTILSRRVINNRLLFVNACFKQKILHLHLTTVVLSVNILLSIKYAWTRSTKTYSKRHSFNAI